MFAMKINIKYMQTMFDINSYTLKDMLETGFVGCNCLTVGYIWDIDITTVEIYNLLPIIC